MSPDQEEIVTLDEKLEKGGTSRAEVLHFMFMETSEQRMNAEIKTATARAEAEHLERKLWSLRILIEQLSAEVKA